MLRKGVFHTGKLSGASARLVCLSKSRIRLHQKNLEVCALSYIHTYLLLNQKILKIKDGKLAVVLSYKYQKESNKCVSFISLSSKLNVTQIWQNNQR